MLCFRFLSMVCVFKHLYCSAQLSMSNMEKRYRNKIIIKLNSKGTEVLNWLKETWRQTVDGDLKNKRTDPRGSLPPQQLTEPESGPLLLLCMPNSTESCVNEQERSNSHTSQAPPSSECTTTDQLMDTKDLTCLDRLKIQTLYTVATLRDYTPLKQHSCIVILW